MARLLRLAVANEDYYDRTGTLWEGRFKSTLVEDESYFLTVSRYIELNPVRAKMVEDPADYPWSSYQRNALGKPIESITSHELYERIGRSEKSRQKGYIALFKHVLDKQLIEQITESTLKGWVLGSNHFKADIEKQLKRRVEPQQRGGDRKSKVYKDNYENQLL